mmetsp:Transcript_28724/g.57296  ORF Transcript_28724/g.57296 Transcript_28724/m.57296 type:complete len:82 (-) Transcript_28724:354-599(-)
MSYLVIFTMPYTSMDANATQASTDQTAVGNCALLEWSRTADMVPSVGESAQGVASATRFLAIASVSWESLTLDAKILLKKK